MSLTVLASMVDMLLLVVRAKEKEESDLRAALARSEGLAHFFRVEANLWKNRYENRGEPGGALPPA